MPTTSGNIATVPKVYILGCCDIEKISNIDKCICIITFIAWLDGKDEVYLKHIFTDW